MFDLIDRTWLWFAAACYLAGFALGTWSLLRDRRHSRGWMYAIISAGFAFQTFGLYLRGLAVKGCPLGNTFEIFQFTAWSAISLFLVIGPTFRLSLLGFFTSMLTAALTLLSLAIPAWDATRRVGVFGGNAWIEFHAAIALFSYGVFALLALTSVMFLLRNYSLKSKRLSGAFEFLPSILDLDHISLRLLGAGVFLLAGALAVGSVYWLRHPETVNTAKLLVTVAVWLAYLGAFSLRLRGMLVAKRLAWTCVALFGAALLSLGPVNSSRHSLPSASSTSLLR
ncbi:MAG TPA: cytochrome c biogenesis protein CcsA [Opitutaceae bacterium]